MRERERAWVERERVRERRWGERERDTDRQRETDRQTEKTAYFLEQTRCSLNNNYCADTR